MQLKTVFRNAVRRLIQAHIPEPELEASLLLAEVLAIPRTWLLLAGEREMKRDQLERFEELLARRLAREPLAYIAGRKEFWSLDFSVSRDVLIPRPETEFLLEKALAVLKNEAGGREKSLSILDAGTGSGNIAVVLALELQSADITAIDLSFRALQLARHNAKKHKVGHRIGFINCSWFDAIALSAKFDAVISNPPYIAGEVLAENSGSSGGSLQPEVGNYEPSLALDGGYRGMREIGRIEAQLTRVLKPGGWLFMEIGADQEQEVAAVFSAREAYDCIDVFRDYAGRPRVLQARLEYAAAEGTS